MPRAARAAQDGRSRPFAPLVALPSRRTALLAALLLAIVAVTYLPVLHAGFIWDDDEYVVENVNLRDTDGLVRIWTRPQSSPQYYPLVFTSFWIERQLFGLDARVSHVVNVLLHALNAGLLWILLRRLSVTAAFVIALVFAVHPVHLESVAWITERKNVLSTAFYLASALSYLAFLDVASDAVRARRWRWYAVSVACFACALLSKTVTATLPAALLLVIWWKRGRITRADLWPLAPMFVLGVGAGALTAWLEVHHVGAQGAEWALTPVARLLLAGRILVFYVGKLLWPTPLLFIYPRWEIDPAAPLQHVPLALVVLTIGLLWLARHRIGRGALAGVLFFAGTLVPALGFFDVYPMRYSFVADHFQYVASIGVIAVVVAGMAWLLGRAGMGRAGVPLAALAIVLLIAVARVEVRKYEGLETLWRDTAARNPEAWIAHNNLGNLLVKEGRYAEARAFFERAIALKPDLAEAHNNLGTAWLRDGNAERALALHRQALEIDPTYAEAHHNVAIDLSALGRHREARDAAEKAIAIDPSNAAAHFTLADALTALGERERAATHYRAALARNPNHAMAHYRLGLLLFASGRREEAGVHLGTAFRLRPDFGAGHYELGNLRLRLGDRAGAMASYAAALQADPGLAEAHSNLGTLLMGEGRTRDAAAHFREAIRLRPSYALAINNLGYVLERNGALADAETHYREALRLAPSYADARANLARVQAARRGHRGPR